MTNSSEAVHLSQRALNMLIAIRRVENATKYRIATLTDAEFEESVKYLVKS